MPSDVLITPASSKVEFTDGSNATKTLRITGTSFSFDSDLGIGITSPSAQLHINSSVSGATLLRADGTNGTLFSIVDDLSDSLMSVNNSAGLPVLEVFADDRVVMGQYGQNDFVLVNNKLGLGTNNPAYKLDINGTLNVSGNTSLSTISITGTITSSATEAIRINNNNGFVSFYNTAGSSRTGYLQGNTGNSVLLASENNALLQFAVGGTVRATINTNGNLGIGTTTPTQLLELKKTTGSAIALLNYNDDVKFNINASSAGVGYVGMVSNHDLLFVTNDNEKWRITTAGVLQSNNAQTIQTSTGNLTLATAAGNGHILLTPHGTGNVGIGVTTPSVKLEVQGNGQFGNDSVTTIGLKLTRLIGGTRTSEHTFHSANNSPWYTYGQNLTWTGELAGTVESSHVYRPYFEAFAPVVGYKIFGFMNVNTGSFTSANIINALVIKNDGNVGIGTTSPTANLTVYNSATPTIDFNTGASTSRGRISATASDFTLAALTSSPLIFKIDASEKVRIAGDGNVGIGATSPSQRLDVRYDDGVTNGEHNVIAAFSRNGANALVLGYRANGSSVTSALIRTADNTPLTLGTSSTTQAVVLLDNGNVGIGSTAPSAKLDVVDAGNFFASRDANGYPRFTVTNGSAQLGLFRTGTSPGGFYIGGDASLFSVWDSSFSRLVNINTSGNIGINVASPLTKLDIANTQANGITMRYDTTTNYQAWIRPYWNSSTDTRIDFAINRTSGATPDVIMSVGYGSNVGIGTVTPSAKLHVVGSSILANNTQINPDSYIGQVVAGNIADGSGWGVSGGIAGNGSANGRSWAIGNSGTDLYFGYQNGSANSTMQTFMQVSSSRNLYLVPVSGNVGIGNTSPTSKLQVTGGIQFGYGSDSIFYTGTGFDASNYLILQNNTDSYGRIGLTINAKTFNGANTPSTNDGWAMDPRSGIRFRGWLSGDSGYDTKFVIQHLLANASNAAGDLGIFAKGFGTTIPAFVLAGGGNVGIGTTSASGKLTVFGTANTIELKQSAAGSATYYVMDNTVETGGRRYRFGYSGASSDKGSFTIYNQTDNITPFTILTNGNIGIGSITPNNKLHVDGSMSVGSGYNTAAPTNGLIVQGNVGIGATIPNCKLDIRGEMQVASSSAYTTHFNYNDVGANFITTANGGTTYFRGSSNNITSMTVDGSGTVTTNYKTILAAISGNVGVGITVPTAKLNVLSSTSLSSVLKAEGINGTLFEVTDDLSNSLMSVNTIGGLPVFEVFANNTIIAGQYGANDLVINGNKVGVGTANPSFKLDVNGTLGVNAGTSDGNWPFIVVDTNTAGGTNRYALNKIGAMGFNYPDSYAQLQLVGANGAYIDFNNAAADDFDARIIYYSNSRFDIQYGTVMTINSTGVGIGTTSPGYLFAVNSASDVWHAQFGQVGGNQFRIGGNTTNGAVIGAYADNTNNNPRQLLLNRDGGNVGVGTNLATAKVESYFSSNSITFNYLATNLNVNSPIPVYGFDVTSGAETRSIKAGIGYERHLSNGRGTLHFYNDSANDTQSLSGNRTTAGDIKMSIDNNGNVGIGSVTPSYKLHVNGDGYFASGISSNGNIYIGKAGAYLYLNGTNSDAEIIWQANGSNRWAMGMNVGDATENFNIYNYTTSSINLSINKASGNVGIGVASPAAKLNIVDSNASPATGNLLVQSTGGNASIRIDGNSTSNYTYLTLAQGGTGKFEIGITPTSSDFYINPNVQSGANGAAIYIKKSDGNVGIGATTINSPLTVYNNSDVWHFRLGGASGELRMGGQTNNGAVIQAYTPGGSVRDLYLQRDGGNIGINTSAPLNKLSVIASNSTGYYGTSTPLAVFQTGAPSTVLIALDANTLNAYSELRLGTAHSTYYPYSAYVRGVQGGGIDYWKLEFGTGNGSSATTKMTIGFDGNVGIGTTTPVNNLHIVQSIPTGAIAAPTNTTLRLDSSSNNYLSFVNTSDNQTYAGLTFTDNNVGGYIVFRNYTGDVTNGSDSLIYGTYQDHIFQTGTTSGVNTRNEVMRIKNGGNVGIGSNAPNNKLHVNGSTSIGSGYNTAGPTNGLIVEGSVGIGLTNPSYKLDVGAVGSNSISVRLTPGYERVRYYGFDLLGYNDGSLWMIGNNATNTLILGSSWDWDAQIAIAYAPGTVGAASGILNIGQTTKNNANYTHGSTRFYANGIERLSIINNGNVGIGISSPAARLHVNSTTSGATLLRADGTNGTLFSVVDDLSDSLMSVNNSAGLPVLEVFADDRVVAGQYGANDFVLVNNKLGLGTNTPNKQLTFAQVDDDPIQIRRRTVSQGGPAAGTGISWTWTSATTDNETWAAIRAIFPGNSDSHLTFSTRNTSAVFGERMRIQNTGNIGIGIQSPNATLHIKPTTVGANGIILERNASTAKLVYMYEYAADGYIEVRSGADVIVSKISGYASTPTYFQSSVGIGTTSPGATLQVGTGSPTASASGIQFGDDTGARLYRSSSNTVRSSSGLESSSWFYAATYLQTGGNLIYPSSYSATQRLEVGNAANNAWIDGLTIAPGGNVVVAGTLTESSSIRYKENIQTINTPILPKLEAIRPVTYNKKDNPNNTEYGIIAEELNELFPELVNKNDNGEIESVNYSRLTVLLIKAVKELKEEVDRLKNK